MDLLIFDLDGTLIDSKRDLISAVNATRAHFGLSPLPDDQIASYVGNGAPVLIRRALGDEATEADVQHALDYFLGYYREHMLDETRLYPGVREMVEKLAGHGVLLAVLTNKPVRFSKAILDGLGVGPAFFRVYGGNSFEKKKPDPVGVETLLAESGVPRDRALMVGDSGVDVLTARNAGIRSCGVTYGLQPETLVEEPPDFTVDTFDQLAALVLAERETGKVQRGT